MIDKENGLAEILHVFDQFTRDEFGNYTGIENVDFSKGVLQSIGYKEFAQYYDQR